MKKKNYIVLKWTIFIGVILLVLQGLTPYFSHRKNKDYNYRAFQNMEDDPDVLIFGTSIAERGIMPNELYKEYGITSYNLSASLQRMDTALFTMESLLKQRNPKVIILSTDGLTVNDKPDTFNVEIMGVREIKGNELKKIAYLFDHFKFRFMEYIKYYLPVLQFHDDVLKNEIQDQKKDNVMQLRKLYDKGYNYTDGEEKVDIVKECDTEQHELSPESAEYLTKIMDFCNQRGIELILVTIPTAYPFPYGDAIRKQFPDCKYIDGDELLSGASLNPECDYYDGDHLNVKGAVKVTDYLGDYLSENYELPDHRLLQEGNLWDAACDVFEEMGYDKYDDEVWKKHLLEMNYDLSRFE